MRKAVSYGRILHRTNPQPQNRFLASGLFIDQPENQFALASCIGGTNHGAYTFIVHQPAQGRKLFFLVVCYLIFPACRENRQIVISPFCVFFIIGFRLRQFYQMADAPRYKPAVAFQITVFFLFRTQHCGQSLCNAGFFCNYKLVLLHCLPRFL